MQSWHWIKVTILCLCSCCLMGSESAPQMEQVIVSVFQQLKITPSFYVVHHGGRTETVWHRSEIDQLANFLAHRLQLPVPMRRENRQTVEFTSSGSWGAVGVIDLKINNLEPKRAWTRPYLSIRITGRGEWNRSLMRARRTLETVLGELLVHPHIDLSLQGTKRAVTNGEHYVNEAQHLMHASEVEALRTQPLLSLSGYTPLATRSLETGGGEMNVQIASRIDRDQRRLIFIIGSPIITIEY